MNRAILCDFSKPFKSIHPQGPGFQTQPYEGCGAIWRPAGAATRHGDKPLTWQAIHKPNCYMSGCDFDTYGYAVPVSIQGQLSSPRAL